MKIAFMTLWNAANGPSIHAELIGRELVDMDHELIVFAPIRHPDARPTNQLDEPYVIRNYSVDRVIPTTHAEYFDAEPLIETEYDIFIAENVERLPTSELYKIFPDIKKKAYTVMVVHEGGPPIDKLYYKFDWDAVVCFDHRYAEWVANYFPSERIYIISYPCHSLKLGDKREARHKLGLPINSKIIFSYGFRVGDMTPVIPTLEDLSREYDLKYLIAVNPGGDIDEARKLGSKYDFIEIRVGGLPLNQLYTYLHASDALLIHRESNRKYKCVLSSTICLTIGSGCPIVFHDSNYVELHGKEILKYRDFNALKNILMRIFDYGFDLTPVKDFLKSRSSRVIAERYIELFNDLIKREKSYG